MQQTADTKYLSVAEWYPGRLVNNLMLLSVVTLLLILLYRTTLRKMQKHLSIQCYLLRLFIQ